MTTTSMLRHHLRRERSLAKWAAGMREILEAYPNYGSLMAVLSAAGLHRCKTTQQARIASPGSPWHRRAKGGAPSD